jgi:hypothetical protein
MVFKRVGSLTSFSMMHVCRHDIDRGLPRNMKLFRECDTRNSVGEGASNHGCFTQTAISELWFHATAILCCISNFLFHILSHRDIAFYMQFIGKAAIECSCFYVLSSFQAQHSLAEYFCSNSFILASVVFMWTILCFSNNKFFLVTCDKWFNFYSPPYCSRITQPLCTCTSFLYIMFPL